MFWTIVGAILFVCFLPMIIGAVILLLPIALVLLGVVLFIGELYVWAVLAVLLGIGIGIPLYGVD